MTNGIGYDSDIVAEEIRSLAAEVSASRRS
jgi:hypothetical protein